MNNKKKQLKIKIKSKNIKYQKFSKNLQIIKKLKKKNGNCGSFSWSDNNKKYFR